MTKAPVIQTTKTSKQFDDIIVDVISINPSLSLYELINKINEEEEKGYIALLSITFEGCIQSDNVSKKSYGKDEKLKIRFIDGTTVPKKTIRFSEEYTTIDLIDAIDELESDLMGTDHKYVMDIFPVRLFILDKGSISIDSLSVIKFAKERKVDKKGEFGSKLRGLQVQPLDAVMVYDAILDKSNKYKFGKKTIPKFIVEEIIGYEQGQYVLKIDHVERYATHIRHASFTGIRSCPVRVRKKLVKTYVPIDDSTEPCKWIPNK